MPAATLTVSEWPSTRPGLASTTFSGTASALALLLPSEARELRKPPRMNRVSTTRPKMKSNPAKRIVCLRLDRRAAEIQICSDSSITDLLLFKCLAVAHHYGAVAVWMHPGIVTDNNDQTLLLDRQP